MSARSSTSFDVEHLIALVEARPVLWDKTLGTYKDRYETRDAWDEIYREINPGYDRLGEKDRHEFGKEIMKKWWNIRDGFVKARKKYIQDASSTAGNTATTTTKGRGKHSGISVIRKYIYDDQLQFLLKRDRGAANASGGGNVGGKQQQVQVKCEDSNSATDDHESSSFHALLYGGADVAAAMVDDQGFSDCQQEQLHHHRDLMMVAVHHGTSTGGASSARPARKESRKRKLASGSCNNSASSSTNATVTNVATAVASAIGQQQDANATNHNRSSLLAEDNRHLSFFRGIAPSLNDFNDDQVIEFQIGVLQLIMDIKRRRTSPPNKRMTTSMSSNSNSNINSNSNKTKVLNILCEPSLTHWDSLSSPDQSSSINDYSPNMRVVD